MGVLRWISIPRCCLPSRQASSSFLGVEALFPSKREMPAIRHWRLIGLAGLALTLASVVCRRRCSSFRYLPPMAIVDLEAGAIGRRCRCGC